MMEVLSWFSAPFQPAVSMILLKLTKTLCTEKSADLYPPCNAIWSFIFQHDNGSEDTANAVKAHLDRKSTHWNTISHRLASQSQELNIIEEVWDNHDREQKKAANIQGRALIVL